MPFQYLIAACLVLFQEYKIGMQNTMSLKMTEIFPRSFLYENTSFTLTFNSSAHIIYRNV